MILEQLNVEGSHMKVERWNNIIAVHFSVLVLEVS